MPKQSTGFTLIEVVLVMAISGLLFLIAFAGQRQLRDQARFDAGINQLIQDVAYTKNYSSSHVNDIGAGNNTLGIQAGAGFELDNAHLTHSPAQPFTEIETLYGEEDSNGYLNTSTVGDVWPPMNVVSDPVACPPSRHPDDSDECDEEFLTNPDPGIRVSKVNGVSHSGVAVYYVNTSMGLRICHDTGPAWHPVNVACAPFDTSPIDVDVMDAASGYTATIEIDPATGVAKRL